jgi:hypothetical protein
MPNSLRLWMNSASAQQKVVVASTLKFTNTVYLQHVASGRRKASGAMAGAIRLATKQFRGLPKVKQRDISDDCKNCEYAKRCEK